MPNLERLGHGLHRPAEAVAMWTDRCAAYLDALPPHTALGGLTAARLHGLWVPAAAGDERLEFALSRPSAAARQLAHTERSEVHVRRRRLRPHDIVEVDGLPVLAVDKL